MNQELFLNLKQRFNNYVSNFSLNDPQEQQNIDLKYKHSYKVCQQMNKITANILNNKESYIAKTIALFHDIGRFQQYHKYKTFADAESEDHAQLGIKVIKNNQLLTAVKAEIQELILKAIQYHNKPYLPKQETDQVLLYTKLIRDADKLDIWRVVIEEYNSETNNPIVGLGLSSDDYISEIVYQKTMNEEVIKYEDLQTLNDFKLLQMGWVYDINFPKSFEIIKKEGYIDKLFAVLPDNKKAKNIYSKIKSHLEKKIK